MYRFSIVSRLSKLTSVVTVHDTSVVEDDVKTAPLIQAVNDSLNVGLLANIALLGGNLTGHLRSHLLGFCHRFLEGGFGNISHDYRCAFAKEQNGRLQTDAAVLLR